MIMEKVLQTSHVKRVAPQALSLKVGESAIFTLPFTASSTTTTDRVTFLRLTEGLFYLNSGTILSVKNFNIR
tara:strand:- start:615 stop:830 length:216 start_codon:yes stop_codon:yes gene_type:complete